MDSGSGPKKRTSRFCKEAWPLSPLPNEYWWWALEPWSMCVLKFTEACSVVKLMIIWIMEPAFTWMGQCESEIGWQVNFPKQLKLMWHDKEQEIHSCPGINFVWTSAPTQCAGEFQNNMTTFFFSVCFCVRTVSHGSISCIILDVAMWYEFSDTWTSFKQKSEKSRLSNRT